MATAERVATPPPHNLEAEQSVLGAILISDRALYPVAVEDRLRPGDFYREQHRVVYAAMLELQEQGQPIDLVTLTEHLRERGRLDDAGGEAALHALTASVPAVGHVRHYAQIVQGNAMERAVLAACYDIQSSVLQRAASPRELVEQAERAILEVAHDGRRQDFRVIGDVLDVELDKLHRLSKEGTALTGTPSGFKDLDDLTGGFQDGNLIVIAARPGMGKSALVTNIAENAAIDHHRPVALFSLEMSEAELAQRFIASQARIKGDELRKGRVAENRWPKILQASQRLSQARLFVDDTSDLGILEIRAKARRLHSREAGGLGLVIVDYLQLMRADGRTDNRAEQVGQMSRGLKILARELDVPVVALSQLNRNVEQRGGDKRPLLSDLRESGCLAGDSRVFLPDRGHYVRMDALMGIAGVRVLALNPRTWQLEPRRVLDAFPTGRKPVCRLTTRLGRGVRATANHRFLTVGGWRRLDELGPGDRVALPRRLPSGTRASTSAPEMAPTTPSMQATIATRHRGSVRYRAAPSRERAAGAATAVGSSEPKALATSDVQWDEVTSIRADGVEKVFDLTVEGLHNFVADDIVVHNSIEQDSDLVMFIYRDEYYNREESEHEGEAELIIAKHRNGPLGKVTLTFRSEYPKFMNFVDPGRFDT